MENTNNKKTIIGGVVLVILASVGFLFYAKQPNAPTSPVLARVGSISITEKDVAYRYGVEQAYGNQSVSGQEILQALIKDATEQEVAKVFGVLPMKIDIENTKEYANKTSKAPEILNAVKAVFGADIVSYDRIYILPKIVNPRLHSFFSNNKEINKEALDKIGKALTEVTTGGNFADVAKSNELQYSTSTISDISQGIPTAMQKYFANKDIPKSKLLTVAESLKAGEINKEIIEDEYSYSVVKLISLEKGLYKIESIVSIKRNYDTWYQEEAKKILVEIVK